MQEVVLTSKTVKPSGVNKGFELQNSSKSVATDVWTTKDEAVWLHSRARAARIEGEAAAANEVSSS